MSNKQATTALSGRVRKLDYKSKKKAVRQNEPVRTSLQLFRQSLEQLWLNRRTFGGLLLVYLLLYLVFVKGLAANFQLVETRNQLREIAGNELGSLGVGAVLFGALIGTAGSAANEAAAVYQTMLFIVMSLAIVWALRQTFESPKRLSITNIFYKSMYPLVPYLLVCLIVLLQLLPALIGGTVYIIVVSNGIAVGAIEQILWLILFMLSVGASLFLISSSIFATYIVTLPNVSPVMALRRARSLVKFRRALIIRKLIFLPLTVGVFLGVIFLPMVIYAPLVAEVLFIIFLLAMLLLSHSYLYSLYKELVSGE